jgi:hypothetical protein
MSILSNFKYLRRNKGVINIIEIKSKFLLPSPKKIAGAIDRDKNIRVIILLFIILTQYLFIFNYYIC